MPLDDDARRYWTWVALQVATFAVLFPVALALPVPELAGFAFFVVPLVGVRLWFEDDDRMDRFLRRVRRRGA